MRRISITLTGVLRAEDENAAVAELRAALPSVRGLVVETKDLGPVEESALAPDNVKQVQGIVQ